MSDKQKRTNYFDLKRDETMALNEYLQSPISDKDLKSNPPVKKIDMSKRKIGKISVKKDKPSIMDLPTNKETKKKNKSKNIKTADLGSFMNFMDSYLMDGVTIGAILGSGYTAHAVNKARKMLDDRGGRKYGKKGKGKN